MFCDACDVPATTTRIAGYLTALPREMIFAIFLNLDGRALANAARTCSAFRDLVLDVRRWWGVPIAATPTRIVRVGFYESWYGGIYQVGSFFVLPVDRPPSAFLLVDIERSDVVTCVNSPIRDRIECIVEFEGLVAVCAELTIYIFDSKWKLVREWTASDHRIGNMCVFEHSLAAPAGSDVILWNASGARSRVLIGHGEPMRYVTVFGRLLATAAGFGATIIALWDAHGTCVRTFLADSGDWIYDFGAFGDLLVTKCISGRVTLWTADGTRVNQMATGAEVGQTSSLVASSRTLAVECESGVSFWTAEGVKIHFISYVRICTRNNIAFAGEHFVHNQNGYIAIW